MCHTVFSNCGWLQQHEYRHISRSDITHGGANDSVINHSDVKLNRLKYFLTVVLALYRTAAIAPLKPYFHNNIFIEEPLRTTPVRENITDMF